MGEDFHKDGSSKPTLVKFRRAMALRYYPPNIDISELEKRGQCVAGPEKR